MAKKRKIKKHYTIAITTDFPGDTTKYYKARVNIFKVAFTVASLVVLIAVGLTVFEFYELDRMESKIKVLKDIITEQEATITRLGDEKAELSSTNEILQDKVAKAVIAEEKNQAEYDARHLPTGFPLTGSAHIVDPDEFFEERNAAGLDEVSAFYEAILAAKKKDKEEGNTDPYVFFSMSDISDVVAVGDGTVTAVSDDKTFGKSVTIDHGNGYVSIYKNSAEPKVNVGDEVVRGAIIFVGGEENNYLEYQLMQDGVFIEPMDIMDIEG